MSREKNSKKSGDGKRNADFGTPKYEKNRWETGEEKRGMFTNSLRIFGRKQEPNKHQKERTPPKKIII